jgi:GTP-binding protein Era
MNEPLFKKSGFVALIGRPNVGKSTLLNCFLGEKVSITSPKPQTTRCQILGIKTLETSQIIFIDTPGLHLGEKQAINRYMNRSALGAMNDADVIVFVVDANKWQEEDEWVLKKLKPANQPIILVLNKIDLLDKAALLPMIEKMATRFSFADIVPLSAKESDNITALENCIITHLPEGDLLFPSEQITDKPIRFHVAEIIREKLIHTTMQELPYATSVEIEQFNETDKLIEISAVIWVERQGQKIIIIGKAGSRLKKIATAARHEIEKLLDKKVFLRMWVKVKTNWTDDEKALRSFGYE